MKEITINIPFTITESLIDGITVSAIEGGIGYWACITDVDTSNMTKEDADKFLNNKELRKQNLPYHCLSEIISKGAVLTLEDAEEEEDWKIKLDLDMVVEGFKAFLEGKEHGYDVSSPSYYEDNGVDAGEADVIIQLGAFGKVVYG